MKIALAQTNPIIGDYQKNCQKILFYIQQAAAAGCELIIFPELAISGYPPQELLRYPAFFTAQYTTLAMLQERIASMDLPIDILLGGFEKNSDDSGGAFFSSAFLLRGNDRIFCSRKNKLSGYTVFNEQDYFHRGEGGALCSIGKKKVIVTLGADLLAAEEGRDVADSITDILAAAEKSGNKPVAIINISAIPFFVENGSQRQLLTKVCRKTGLPLLYCNQAGGQDSLVFAGGSLAINGEGEILAQARFFDEDMVIADLDLAVKQSVVCNDSDKEESLLAAVHDALVAGLKDYMRKCGFTKVVLGLSGGIDSAVTAVLAVEALGAENVLGVALPSLYSSDASLIDAKQLAQNLGCRFAVLPIGGLFQHYKDDLCSLFAGYEDDVTEQNLQARIRGNLLMALANKFESILLNTGNKSELAVGYSTLYGDMCGGLAVIADLPKGLVYQVAEYINRHDERIPHNTITRAPSAELKPGQKDQDELPPYEILDQIVDLYLDGCGEQAIVAKGFDQAVVEDVLRRIRINEYKRKQAPPGLNISTRSFTGRHYPAVHNFRG